MPLLYWQDDESGETESVELDATQTESHEDVMVITDHPVEQGANVSDHAREEPTRLTIEGLVSNIPNPRLDDDTETTQIEVDSYPSMGDPGTQTQKLTIPKPPLEPSLTGLLQAGIGALANAITGGPDHTATFTGNPKRTQRSIRFSAITQTAPRNRARDVYEKLLKAQSRRFLVTAQTRNREHFDMLIERIAHPRSVEDGSASRFQIDLRRIRVADSETVLAPQPTEARGMAAKSRGSQAAKPDPNAGKKEEVFESNRFRESEGR